MKKVFSIILALCTLYFVLCTQTSAYTIHHKTVVEIPLDDYYLQIWVGSPTASVKEKNRSLGASIGINGSFFCPKESAYNYCGANNGTSSDRIVAGVVHSKYPNDTGERAIIGVTENNEPLFVQNNNRQ